MVVFLFDARLPLYLLFLFISLVFLVVNLACALLVRMSSAEARTVVLVRVAINDTLFVLCAVSLSLCLYKIAKMSLANIYLESKVRRSTGDPAPGVKDPPLDIITQTMFIMGTAGVSTWLLFTFSCREPLCAR